MTEWHRNSICPLNWHNCCVVLPCFERSCVTCDLLLRVEQSGFRQQYCQNSVVCANKIFDKQCKAKQSSNYVWGFIAICLTFISTVNKCQIVDSARTIEEKSQQPFLVFFYVVQNIFQVVIRNLSTIWNIIFVTCLCV